MFAEGGFVALAHEVVELALKYGQQRVAEAPFDRGAVGIDELEPECEEVVGNALTTAACERVALRYGHDPLKQPHLHEPVEHAARLGAHRVADLVVLGAARGDDPQRKSREVTALRLRLQHELPPR